MNPLGDAVWVGGVDVIFENLLFRILHPYYNGGSFYCYSVCNFCFCLEPALV